MATGHEVLVAYDPKQRAVVPAYTDHAVAAVGLLPNSDAIFSDDGTLYSVKAKPDLHALSGKGIPIKAVVNAAHGIARTLAAASSVRPNRSPTLPCCAGTRRWSG